MRLIVSLLVLLVLGTGAEAQSPKCGDRGLVLGRVGAPVGDNGYEEFVMLRWMDPETGQMREITLNPVTGTLTEFYTNAAKPGEICARGIGIGAELIPYATGNPA